MFKSEIAYGKTTLPQCCKRIGERQEAPFDAVLLKIHRIMGENTGESFSAVFSEEMRQCLKALPLAGEDREAFLAFASGESFGDRDMQLRTVEHSYELLKVIEEKLRCENAEKCRLAVGLGAMSGVLLVIVLA